MGKSRLQMICELKNISTVGELVSRVGNNVELATILNCMDDIKLKKVNLKDVLYICRALNIKPEELFNMDLIKNEVEKALLEYYQKNPMPTSIRKAHCSNYTMIKKTCDRGNLTKDECEYILQEMKRIKQEYLQQNDCDNKVKEFLIDIRKIYAPYFLRNKVTNKYTEKMRYLQYIYNIKNAIIQDLLKCSKTYYINFTTGYVSLNVLSIENAVKLSVIYNTTVMELFDEFYGDL